MKLFICSYYYFDIKKKKIKRVKKKKKEQIKTDSVRSWQRRGMERIKCEKLFCGTSLRSLWWRDKEKREKDCERKSDDDECRLTFAHVAKPVQGLVPCSVRVCVRVWEWESFTIIIKCLFTAAVITILCLWLAWLLIWACLCERQCLWAFGFLSYGVIAAVIDLSSLH